MSSDTREAVAGAQHEIWAHWMRYLFNMARHNPDGSVTIPAELVGRWTRQTETCYADLTEREQESDRHQADKVLLAMGWTLVETPCDCTPESRPFCWRCQRTGVRRSTAPANQENSEAEDRLQAKTRVIAQMLRILAGNDYAAIVRAACNGEDGPDTYMWNVGIAP